MERRRHYGQIRVKRADVEWQGDERSVPKALRSLDLASCSDLQLGVRGTREPYAHSI